MKIKLLSLLALGCTLGAQASTSFFVPGTSDLWLAGMPNGSTAGFGDVAPDQSPVYVPISLVAGSTLYFSSVTGGTAQGPGYLIDPVDGGIVYSHAIGAENGIATLTAPINALIGVFLDATQPDSSAAPAGLDFTSGQDYLTISPGLKQPFFIGDGLAFGTTQQGIVVPVGAQNLWIGTMDGYGWYNNQGSISGNVDLAPVPEASSVMSGLALSGMIGLGFIRRFRAA